MKIFVKLEVSSRITYFARENNSLNRKKIELLLCNTLTLFEVILPDY